MINIELKKNSESLFKSELDQAWSHYRHLEETRTKYLSFFFTILLASIGFSITIVKDISETISIELYFGFAIFNLVLFLISIIILASIIRIGYVLTSYEYVMQETRNYFHGKSSEIIKVWDIRKNIPLSVNKGIFSIQKSSKTLVLGVCSILFTLQVSIANQLLILTNSFQSYYVLSTLISLLIMIIVLLYIIIAIYKANSETKCNKSLHSN